MKTHFAFVFSIGCLTAIFQSAPAQTTTADQAWRGQINYEAVRKIDPPVMNIMINGEQIKPGDPNYPTDLPDTRTFGQKVLIANQFAKESRDQQNMAVRVTMGPGGSSSSQTTNLGRPFEEQLFVDLANQKTITLLTIGKDKDAKTYRAETPIQRATDWQVTDQTRKIAGYSCRKATATYRKELYSVWFTTDLPVTYSPIRELTPETGVVLLVEGSREQFRATKVTTSVPDAKVTQPSIPAQLVTPAQLADLRQKAMADFQQQLMTNERD